MIRNYIKITLRAFWRHKLFTLINILGLSIGISAALVIYLIVNFDFSFDTFHKDSERIYRVVSVIKNSGETYNVGAVTGPLPDAIKSSLPGISLSAKFFTTECNVLIGNKNPTIFKNQTNIIYTVPNYFEMFHYQWLMGSPQVSLNEPNKVVLSLAQATKYFPELSMQDIIGQQVIYNDSLKTTVSGIVKELTGNTDLTFHDFISYSTINSDKELKKELQDWTQIDGSNQLYVKLNPNVSSVKIQTQINDIVKGHRSNANNLSNSKKVLLQSLSDLHFNADFRAYENPTVNKNNLYGLILVGIFILSLGCINFINLTTAQSSQRAKEIGIRKTLGSGRGQLISQFLGETLLITIIAVILALSFTPLILKLFAEFISTGIQFSPFHQINILLFLSILVITITLLSGFYPAIILSNFKAVTALKTQTAAGNDKTSATWLRKFLTVSQFIIAQFFIMATIMVVKQVSFILHKDLGFKQNAIVYFSFPDNNENSNNKLLLLNKLKLIPEIESVSLGGDPPSSKGRHSTGVTFYNGSKEIQTDLQAKYGDENYLSLYHIKLLAGQNMAMKDSTSGVLVNLSYLKLLNINAREAVGKFLTFSGNQKRQIVGVFADFQQGSLYNPIKPLAIYPDIARFNNMHIALKPLKGNKESWATALKSVKQAWSEVYPQEEFDYQFLDQTIAKFYNSEKNTTTLLTWATGLSIFISSLGMLGFALYTINLRKKEVGIRKVLGASVGGVVMLLSGEIINFILISFIIATPIAWFAIHVWLQHFAERTQINWWIFILSGLGMIIVCITTLGFQTLKAALANPVKSLKNE